MDTNGQDDEDFPLADHPEYTGPKAGDADMNRARDLRHLDVARGLQPVQRQELAQQQSESPSAFGNPPVAPPTGIPDDAPVMVAWTAFKQTPGWPESPYKGDGGFNLFLAGWSARDAKGE